MWRRDMLVVGRRHSHGLSRRKTGRRRHSSASRHSSFPPSFHQTTRMKIIILSISSLALIFRPRMKESYLDSRPSLGSKGGEGKRSSSTQNGRAWRRLPSSFSGTVFRALFLLIYTVPLKLFLVTVLYARTGGNSREASWREGSVSSTSTFHSLPLLLFTTDRFLLSLSR